MSISVIIPTTLGEPAVAQPLESVVRSASAIDGAEVLVVANGLAPRWYGDVLDAPNVRLLESTDVGAAAARNLGLSEARHRYVLFTDDDCMVPPSWCKDMAEAIARAGTAAVAAPVGVESTGPVTAYLDYQRVFDAPPLEAHTVRYVITANCAVDRNRTSARFDAEFSPTIGAEDVEFGYQIRDRGATIGWLGDVPEVAQTLSDDITEITGRFHKYGRGSALMYRRFGRTGESASGATVWLASLAAGKLGDRRRFREFRDARIRAALTTIDLITAASWLLGYLAELGLQLEHDIIEADWSGLAAGWRDLATEISAMSSGVDWPAIGPEPSLLWTSADPEPDGLLDAIGDVLTRNVRIAADLPDDVAAVLRRRDDRVRLESASAKTAAAKLAATGARERLGVSDLKRNLRAAGLTFRDGMRMLEQAISA